MLGWLHRWNRACWWRPNKTETDPRLLGFTQNSSFYCCNLVADLMQHAHSFWQKVVIGFVCLNCFIFNEVEGYYYASKSSCRYDEVWKIVGNSIGEQLRYCMIKTLRSSGKQVSDKLTPWQNRWFITYWVPTLNFYTDFGGWLEGVERP